MIILLFSVYSYFNLSGINGVFPMFKQNSFYNSHSSFVYETSLFSEGNSGGIKDNKLLRMAVEFGVTEGLMLLKHIYFPGRAGGDFQALGIMYEVTTDVFISSVFPGVSGFFMKDRKPWWKYGLSFLGACAGEGLGALLYYKNLYPFLKKDQLVNEVLEGELIGLPSVIFSVIIFNL